MINIAISGATGRMGQTLIRCISEYDELRLSAAIEQQSNQYCEKPLSKAIGIESEDIIISNDLQKAEFDVLIDFTRPQATMNYLDCCLKHNKAMVIGTTGFSSDQHEQIQAAAKNIPIVMAPNMSLGVNLLFKLIQIATRSLANQADIEIIEAHHKHKVDAPSGTAIAMGEVVAKEKQEKLSDIGVFARHGHTGARKSGEVGFSVIRAADIIGEHTALFALAGERIEISHKASDRAIYARGALFASSWLSGKNTPGLFSMEDVLNFE